MDEDSTNKGGRSSALAKYKGKAYNLQLGECIFKEKTMKHVCDPCGYVYDQSEGDSVASVKAGTAFTELPANWVCPLCGVGKDQFYEFKG